MPEELNFDHEPSLYHWVHKLANDMLDCGDHNDWDAAYESALRLLDDTTLTMDLLTEPISPY